VWRWLRHVCEGKGLGHRLAVLELVLSDHADEEVVLRKLGKQLQHSFAYLLHVGACGFRREDGKRGALSPAVGEGVIEVVALRHKWLSSAGSPQQPELLEVPDMSEIPDEGRLERRDLASQLLVVEWLEQGLGSLARMLERRRELSR
jgi:hypothetical protein